MLEKSSIISSPTMFSEEIAIETIFKHLSRADKVIANLTETLKSEAKFKNQLIKKIDFSNVHSNEATKQSYECRLDSIRTDLHSEYSEKLSEIMRKHNEQICELKKQLELDLRQDEQRWKQRLNHNEGYYQQQLDRQVEQIKNEYEDKVKAFRGERPDSASEYSSVNNQVKLQTFRSYINPDVRHSDSRADSHVSLSDELDRSRTELKQEEEKRYKRFIEEFTDYRKQEIDLFKTSQVKFVKNLQKEVGKLTDIVQTVIHKGNSSQEVKDNVSLYSLQDSIEHVSNHLQNYFTKVTNNSNENDSYFSGCSNDEERKRRKCNSQMQGGNVKMNKNIFE
jgi:F0F1-type ATP synthase membrane subunit b/b'